MTGLVGVEHRNKTLFHGGLSEYSIKFSRFFNPTDAIISLTDNLLFAIAFIKRLIFSLSICNGLSELVGVLDGVLDGVEMPMSLGALITMKRFLNSLFSPINRLRKNRSK